MTDKERLCLVLKYAKITAVVLVLAMLVGGTWFAAKFCVDFFRNGLFGDGSTYGFVGEFLGIPEPTAPPETEPVEVGTGVVSRASIVVGGDVVMHNPVIKSGLQADGTYNYDSAFAQIESYVNRADYAVLNLETTLAGTEKGREYSGSPNFNSPDEIVDGAKNAGFDMLLTANSHSNHTGAAGFRRTYETITGKGLSALGTRDSEEIPGYQVVDINGIRIGMVCYTHGTYGSGGRPAVDGRDLDDSVAGLINVFSYENTEGFYSDMEAKIAAMKADGAEAIVLFIHWGDQYKLSPTNAQTTIAQKMCDLGVDVIVGGHPSVVQPVALLTSTADENRKTLCVYSLGNLLSNQRSDNVGVPSGHTEDGILLTFTFAKYSGGDVYLETADLLPIWIHMWKENDVKHYAAVPLDASKSDWNLEEVPLASAKKSYERTMTTTGPGMTAAQTALEEARIQRETAMGLEDEGVG